MCMSVMETDTGGGAWGSTPPILYLAMCPYVYVEFRHGQIQEVKLGAPSPLFSMLNLAVACHNELYVCKWLS